MHGLTGSLGLLAWALFAIRFAEWAATPERTYGFYRMEILAALAKRVCEFRISGPLQHACFPRVSVFGRSKSPQRHGVQEIAQRRFRQCDDGDQIGPGSSRNRHPLSPYSGADSAGRNPSQGRVAGELGAMIG